MTNEFDFSIDWLAEAPLTLDQRRAWNMLRGSLATAQAKNQELLDQIQQNEKKLTENVPVILTRPEFNREVARMLAFDERYGGISSILYFDFDQLEETAATFGRAVANAALREIGEIMTKNLRSSDIIGRLASDEFGVLLMRCDNAAAWRKAEVVAIKLQNALSEIHTQKLKIKVSYGAYTFRDREDVSIGLKEAAQTMLSVAQ
jgi:diguanylate cyclase (GGDEF)-like protein